MTGWVLYDDKQYKKNEWFANKLLEGWPEEWNVQLIIVNQLSFGIVNGKMTFFYKGEMVDVPDFSVSRVIFPFLLETLEACGVKVFNNSITSAICNDKRKTYLTVNDENIPILSTLFCDRQFMDGGNQNLIDYPLIVKSSAGHGGESVFWVNDSKQKGNTIDSLDDNYYVEQEVGYPFGRDLRVYIMGGKIIASVLRESQNFKSNYSLGGKACLYELSDEESELVYRIIAKMPTEMDFVGIDFLVCDKNLYFNEIEDVVGTRMLYSCTNIDAAAMYVKYITKKLTK